MKRLESVKLVQFLLYEQQEFRLEEITGLFGRNGSGKSSALDAVQIDRDDGREQEPDALQCTG